MKEVTVAKTVWLTDYAQNFIYRDQNLKFLHNVPATVFEKFLCLKLKSLTCVSLIEKINRLLPNVKTLIVPLLDTK